MPYLLPTLTPAKLVSHEKYSTCACFKMRNILLSDFESHCLSTVHNCQVFYYDRQCLYAYDKGVVIKSFESNEKVICNLTCIYPVHDVKDIPTVLDITYCYEKELLYIILENGDIISLDVDNEGSETVIGSVESGIKSAKWSPEQEVIALVTGDDSVIVMTNDFDEVSEVKLHSAEFGEKQFITVGWGKKETQFRGSEGKFSKNISANEKIFAEHNDVIKISWRGDAEYFVVSSINPKTNGRYLRIFSKGGVLQYTSEDVNNLEHCLDWCPSGNLIASTRKLPNKYVVCFFEKNGLQHGEFDLRLSQNEIIVNEIFWNRDSKILALSITKTLEKFENYIQLYTVSNYHWYCKYTISFEVNEVPLLIQWDFQKYNTLHVILKQDNKVYHNKYSWLWGINKSKGNDLNDESFVAVIDGCDLKLTSFKQGIMPPPMCNYVLQQEIPVNSVSFGPDDNGGSSNDLVVQLCDNSILFYKFISEKTEAKNHKLIGRMNGFAKNEVCYNLQWVSSMKIFLCAVKKVNENSKFFLKSIYITNMNSIIGYEEKEIPVESSIVILKASKSGILVHDNKGGLHLFDNNGDKMSSLNENIKQMFLEIEYKNQNFFGLDTLNKFYINNKVLLNNVLSFHIHENFVLLTTMKHELICINYKEVGDGNASSDLFKRKVERGSRLVTSVHKDMKVILQMPRGNLECVQPRALSLFVLGKYLDNLKYYESFDLMRKQRINLNLLYDHNPKLFIKNVNIFVEQITDLQWISLFLTDLSDEDVTKTMYSVIYKNKTDEKNYLEGKSKVEMVCELLEKTLTEKDSEKYFLPILTCRIKRGSIEHLEFTLLKLKELKEKELRGIKPIVSFEEAFRYVVYLVDVDELYKIALGMYDFDLVLIVASKSQKDPKEYLPFLNDLKKLERNYQKYSIDKYLKRYEKALGNLILCDGDDVFSECITFIKAHQLYKLALKLIPKNTDRYKNVCTCYGEDLMARNFYEEAGIMFSNAGMYKNAIEAYRKSGNWQEVLSCGRELKLNENALNELYLDLATELGEIKQFKESATIYLDYLKNVEEGVMSLCQGKLFAEAYRICHLYERWDLTNSVIMPAIIEQGNIMVLQIANFRETFTKQRNRLEVVRKQKEAFNNKPEVEGDDLFSESNTIITQSNATSRTTNKTYRSAKNKRKHERKLLSLKEGSPYEDLALITSLHNTVTNCVQLKPEIRELNKFLIKIRNNDLAEKIQGDFKELLNVIELSQSEIWTPELLNQKQYYGPEATANDIAAMYMKSEIVTPVLLNPKFAVAPELQNNVKWQLEILSS